MKMLVPPAWHLIAGLQLGQIVACLKLQIG